MSRSFKLPNIAWGGLKDPQVLVRIALGILLAANLVAAAFAFHLLGDSPDSLNRDLAALRTRLQQEQAKLTRSRALAANIDTGREQGDKFLTTYITGRRHTYSTIIGELTAEAKAAGMTMQDASIAPLEDIEGSNDLSMMSVSVNFQGGYNELMKFVNALDRSPRFLILDSIQVAPQPNGTTLNVNIKLNTFVREDEAGAL